LRALLTVNQQECQELILVIHSLSNSLNDNYIWNYNKLFWLRNSSVEAVRLRNIGKEIGFTNIRFEDKIIRQIEVMDQKDKDRNLRRDAGDS